MPCMPAKGFGATPGCSWGGAGCGWGGTAGAVEGAAAEEAPEEPAEL